ncbi:MAG: zinc-binding alcohol dehydrogenase family protein [Fusobacteriaceae bacterium]|jgi:L-gulonate 5-dehydrogenase|nr:zinc-binding alcohol dehydrogenase family protein [Fusobacteriaceae bacterium]
MKAVKVLEPFKIDIIEIDMPKIENEYDVIVKVTSGGICGSDMGIWNGTNSLATYPRIIGHEFGGVVNEIGSGVKNVKIGDRVAVDPIVSCGHCYACTIGRHNVCSTLEVMGVHRDGGFTEYVKVPEKNIHKFHIDFDESLLGLVEPFTIGMQINNRLQTQKDERMLIMGSGPIGICAMQVAKSRGVKVLMTDIVMERLEKAKDMGADEIVLTTKDNLNDRINKFTNGEGMPIVLDTVCIPETFEESISYASPAGRVAVIGLKNKPSNIVMADITKKELTIVGSRLNCNCFDEVIEGFETKKLNPEKLKTKEFNFMDARAAIDAIEKYPQNILKVVLKFE